MGMGKTPFGFEPTDEPGQYKGVYDFGSGKIETGPPVSSEDFKDQEQDQPDKPLVSPENSEQSGS